MSACFEDKSADMFGHKERLCWLESFDNTVMWHLFDPVWRIFHFETFGWFTVRSRCSPGFRESIQG